MADALAAVGQDFLDVVVEDAFGLAGVVDALESAAELFLQAGNYRLVMVEFGITILLLC